MRIEFLGAQGGVSSGHQATSFLINDDLLIDAGAVASALPVERQKNIDYIFLTHSHLDHIKDLPFLCDNCFAQKDEPFKVYSHPTTIGNLKKHIFNDRIWPNFAKLPNREKPTFTYNEILPEKEIKVGRYSIQAVLVNHPEDSYGFIVDDGEKSVLFSGDTFTTDRIWDLGKQKNNLKVIVTEVSFPNNLFEVAKLSSHHTPESFSEEYKKFPKGVDIYLTHLKPAFQGQVITEINHLNLKNVHIVYHDGKIIKF